MCLAIPGKIIALSGKEATISYDSENKNQRQAKVEFGDFKPGDFVIVNAGIVIERVPAKEALKIWEDFKNV